jgi:uncharacterized protein (TIGR03083 family)
MDYLVPRDQAFDLFRRAGRRVERILSALPGHGVRSDTQVPHMNWTVGELALHLVQGVEIAGELQQGKPSPFTDIQRISEVNARLLTERSERDIQRLLPEFSRSVRRMEERFREMPDDFRVPFHAGMSFAPPQAMAMMSTELLVHGWDLAQVIDEDFVIDPADARLMIYAVASVMPGAVDRDAAAGFTATYELRIRGGACLRLHFDDGDLIVSHVEPGGPADCRISADASAFLLMGYGRGSQLVPLLTGKVVAWGRKPWLAGAFTRLVRTP